MILGGKLVPTYDEGHGGSGGWWILFEHELHLGPDILVPDLAGWRRERLPALPETAGRPSDTAQASLPRQVALVRRLAKSESSAPTHKTCWHRFGSS